MCLTSGAFAPFFPGGFCRDKLAASLIRVGARYRAQEYYLSVRAYGPTTYFRHTASQKESLPSSTALGQSETCVLDPFTIFL